MYSATMTRRALLRGWAGAVRPAAMMLLTLRGTPTIYMGEEIGMEDGEVPLDRLQDPLALNVNPKEGAIRAVHRSSGPPSPMPVSRPLNPGYPSHRTTRPVMSPTENGSKISVFALPPPAEFPQRPRRAPPGNVSLNRKFTRWMFCLSTRTWQRAAVSAINFIENPLVLALDSVAPEGRIVLSTELDRDGLEKLSRLELRPYEA